MTSSFTNIPGLASSWKQTVPSMVDLPLNGNQPGDAIVTSDDGTLYTWDGDSWNASGGGGGGGITELTGDIVAGPGTGSQAATISNGVVTNAKISGSAAIDFSKLAPLTSTNILVGSNLNVATSRAITGDVAFSNTGVTTIGNDVVTNAKLAEVNTATFKGRTTGGTGNPEDLTTTQATALLNTFSTSTKGLVPGPSGSEVSLNRPLRADGTFASTIGVTTVYADPGPLSLNSSTQEVSVAGFITLTEQSSPTTGPTVSAGHPSIYPGTDGNLYFKKNGLDPLVFQFTTFIDGGAPNSNYVASQVINGGTP